MTENLQIYKYETQTPVDFLFYLFFIKTMLFLLYAQ